MKLTRGQLRKIILEELEGAVKVVPIRDIQTSAVKIHGKDQTQVRVVDNDGNEETDLAQSWEGADAVTKAEEYVSDLKNQEPQSSITDDEDNPLGIDTEES